MRRGPRCCNDICGYDQARRGNYMPFPLCILRTCRASYEGRYAGAYHVVQPIIDGEMLYLHPVHTSHASRLWVSHGNGLLYLPQAYSL